MREVVDRSLGQQWLVTGVLLVFASASLFMAAVGVYGVAAYGVRQRAREFSVRMALGADRRDVLMIVLMRGAAMAGIGLAVGLAGALLAARGLRPMLHEVERLRRHQFGVARRRCWRVTTLLRHAHPCAPSRAPRADDGAARRLIGNRKSEIGRSEIGDREIGNTEVISAIADCLRLPDYRLPISDFRFPILNTRPPFITNVTSRSFVMSATGSPETATMSAS